MISSVSSPSGPGSRRRKSSRAIVLSLSKRPVRCTSPTSSCRRWTTLTSVPMSSPSINRAGPASRSGWPATGKKNPPRKADFYITGVIRSGNPRQQSGTDVNVTNTRLLVGEVQSNVFDRVELQTSTVGETVVAHIGFLVREVVVLEFTVTNTHYTVDACPVVQTVSRTCGDAVGTDLCCRVPLLVLSFSV